MKDKLKAEIETLTKGEELIREIRQDKEAELRSILASEALEACKEALQI